MRTFFGFGVAPSMFPGTCAIGKRELTAKAPTVKLGFGDRLLVMGVSGLPRLEGRHEYTQAEIDGAKFDFSLWTVSEG